MDEAPTPTRRPRQPRVMTASEMGKRGGAVTAARHPTEHYQAIGRKGAQVRKANAARRAAEAQITPEKDGDQ